MYFQELVLKLQEYWGRQGCLLTQPYDVEKGAATFSSTTFLRALGPEPFKAAYIEPCRRPTDGRYGDNPIRLQHYYQFQVVMKPNPDNFLERYIDSLGAIGIQSSEHDIRFVHDDWESPTLGAWGLGWEVWADGMEITQFTYFQQVGGFELSPVMGEITYGLERLCMFLQNVDNVYELDYNAEFKYGDLYHQNEIQCSRHNFELADIQLHIDLFKRFENECNRLCDAGSPLSALDYCLKSSHSFNILDARGAISVNERQGYILRVRKLARAVAAAWLTTREDLGYPLLDKLVESDLSKSDKASNDPVSSHVGDATSEKNSRLKDETKPFLLEIGVEEMPARVFGRLRRELPDLITRHFADLDLNFADISLVTTPRRIAIFAPSVRTQRPVQKQAVKGPPLNIARDADENWTAAAIGFARKNGVSVNELDIREIKGVKYLFAAVEKGGGPAGDMLSTKIPQFLRDISWYKTMRWGRSEAAFVRPVKWIAAVLGDLVIPFQFGGICSGDSTRGHRFLSPRPQLVKAEKSLYLEQLKSLYVVADHDERREQIRSGIEKIALENGLVWVADEELLEEVTNLVEYPVPILCEFDDQYLKIPAIVLISEMKGHQKYFALHDHNGNLANSFISVSNMICADANLVKHGYEKVLRSRFADAEFFLAEDMKRPLADRVPNLSKLIFQAELGSIADKGSRVRTVSRYIASSLSMSESSVDSIEEIATLCKADLITNMVGEFPDLQGKIGSYYAAKEGLSAVVAGGIRDHYLPRSLNDELPLSVEAAVVGLADRLDTLTGIFGIGKEPTGSADPFGLRRACLTSIAIIIGKNINLRIDDLLNKSIETYSSIFTNHDGEKLKQTILDFYLTRLIGVFQENSHPTILGGYAADTIKAVINASMPWYDLVDLAARISTMNEFRNRSDFVDVAATFKRANNIIKEDNLIGEVDPDKFKHDEEIGLWRAIQETEVGLSVAIDERKYGAALEQIAPLRMPVNTFFDAVLVNDPDSVLMKNRKLLVQRVAKMVKQIADFSALQGV